MSLPLVGPLCLAQFSSEGNKINQAQDLRPLQQGSQWFPASTAMAGLQDSTAAATGLSQSLLQKQGRCISMDSIYLKKK